MTIDANDDQQAFAQGPAIVGAEAECSPSGFSFAFADRIDYLRPDVWDELTANASIFVSRSYLRLNEQHGPRELGHRYAILYRDTHPVAAVACQSLDIDGTQLVNLADSATDKERFGIKQTVHALREKALAALRRRILCCGNLLSWGPHGWAVAPGEDTAAVWKGIADALYRIRRADKLAGQVDYVIVKDMVTSGVTGQEALHEFGYRQLETEPEMTLEIRKTWYSYDDYLASLNKKYRKAVRNVRDAIDQAGCVVEQLENVDSQSRVLHQLYEQVAARADARITSQPPDYLPAMAEHFGPDRFRFIVIRRDDQIIGFVTTLRDGDTAVGYYLGLDYETNAEMPIYLRLLHAVVEDALRMGARRVSFGRTALEPKARLGAQPVSTHIWIRHRVPVLNFVVRHLLKAVPHGEAPERSPFKSEA